MLQNKKIIVGVTGGIAAYKTAYIIRELVKRGAEVKVLMTEKAKEFITPLTLATLSKNPVCIDFFDPTNGAWNSHVSLGIWADAFLIAPATANTLAKMANGIADNLLLTTYLSAKCPVFVAPAMDLDMFKHSATQHNLELLRQNNCYIIEPTSGELASGLDGKGRMEEPLKIVEFLENALNTNQPLKGKKILITAGPTYEKIDPVRFIGNYSSGKMGFALAEKCAEAGAEVILVAGPVALKTQNQNIQRIDIESAKEMNEVTCKIFSQCDGAILSAAVADFSPKSFENEKIKKKGEMTLELQQTPDIAENLGKAKTKKQFLVGFALETNDEESNAQQKLKRKNFDFIVLNSMREENTCFGVDTNKINIIHKNGEIKNFTLKTKTEVAQDIVDEIVSLQQK